MGNNKKEGLSLAGSPSLCDMSNSDFYTSFDTSYYKTKYLVENDDMALNKAVLSNICTLDTKTKYLVTDIENKYSSKKIQNELLAESYLRIGKNNSKNVFDSAYTKRSLNVVNCGTDLTFKLIKFNDGSINKKLINANFCKDRLCPMCGWRRSLKIYGQISKIFNEIDSSKYSYIFVTFTVPSVMANDLSSTLDKMQDGFSKLVRRKKIKNAVLGSIRVLEITRNNDPDSKSYGLYHPHYHVIFVVKNSYFKKDYINHSEWLNNWRSVMKDDSISQVNVQKVKNKNGDQDLNSVNKAIREVSKYSVKGNDILFENDPDKTDEVVFTFSRVLKSRRLFILTGIFKDIHKQLNLDDAEDGDLTDDSDEKIDNGIVAELLLKYTWGAGCYKLFNIEEVKID